jgi:hypothetical protein
MRKDSITPLKNAAKHGLKSARKTAPRSLSIDDTKNNLPIASEIPVVVPVVRMVEVTEEHDGQRLDNFLMRLCKGVPKSHIYKAVRGGEVRVNKGRVAPDDRIKLGDMVRVPPMRLPAADEKRTVPGFEFPIVFEDEGLLVIEKRCARHDPRPNFWSLRIVWIAIPLACS